MKMVCKFTSELVELGEVPVGLVVTVGRPDEAAVAESVENSVNGIAVVIAPGSEVGDGSRLVELIEDFESFARQQLREVDVGVLLNEVLVNFDRPSVREDDSVFVGRRVPCR